MLTSPRGQAILRQSPHPVTGETLLPGQEVSEPSVLEWLGRIMVAQRRDRMLRSGVNYDHQDGCPG